MRDTSRSQHPCPIPPLSQRVTLQRRPLLIQRKPCSKAGAAEVPTSTCGTPPRTETKPVWRSVHTSYGQLDHLYIVHATPTRVCRSLASQSLTCRVHITGRASPPRVLRNTGGRGRSGLTISFHPLCGVSTCCRNRTSFTVRRIVRHSKHCRTRRAALPPAASLTATEACPLTRGHGRFSCQTNQQQPFCYRHQSGQASTSDTRVLTATCQAWPDWPW